jgi:hypothetical protein
MLRLMPCAADVYSKGTLRIIVVRRSSLVMKAVPLTRGRECWAFQTRHQRIRYQAVGVMAWNSAKHPITMATDFGSGLIATGYPR